MPLDWIGKRIRHEGRGNKSDYMRTLCLIIEEVLDLARRTVICYDSEAFVVHIKD